VEEYNLPTAPPKRSDGRSKYWRGETCQLEALPPDVIGALLEEAIADYIDVRVYQDDLAAERVEKQQIAFALPAPRGPAP
jgi:hypothetical protein